MKRSLLFSALLFALLSSASIQCQQLAVQIDSGKQVIFSRSDIEALPHVKVTATEHSSGPVTFEGVSLGSVLQKAGVGFGESMKGKGLTNCLLVEAADGYRVVRCLKEGQELAGQFPYSSTNRGLRTLAQWEGIRWQEPRHIALCPSCWEKERVRADLTL